jgi:DNA invertase Pin-like site-specific DNA recombinase
MSGQRIGYVRVSSVGQNTDRQLDGIQLDQVFEDRASAKNAERPGLQAMLSHARDGDIIIVHSMDRLARNLFDLRQIVDDLTSRGVQVQFEKEGLLFTGDDKAISKLLLNVMGAFAEFERSLIRERQLEGIAVAKRDGKYKGRSKALSVEQVADLRQQAASGTPKTQLAESFGVSRQTVYHYLNA